MDRTKASLSFVFLPCGCLKQASTSSFNYSVQIKVSPFISNPCSDLSQAQNERLPLLENHSILQPTRLLADVRRDLI